MNKYKEVKFSFISDNPEDSFRLSSIHKKVVEVLKQFTLDETETHDIILAIEEAASNIIEHSYKNDNKPCIHFTFRLYPLKIVIIIQDFGKNGKNLILEKVGIYATKKELLQHVLKVRGGMGVYLIKKVMDSVSYSHDKKNGNKLVMEKKLKN